MDTQTQTETLIQETIDRFWETVPPTWNRVRSHVRSIASEQFEISIEQFHILRHIRKGFQSVSELASVRQISRPAVSQAVDALVEKGLISRRQDTQDRRYVHLRLTASGEELLNKIFSENRAWMAARLATLPPEEMQTILRALDVLRATFEESLD